MDKKFWMLFGAMIVAVILGSLIVNQITKAFPSLHGFDGLSYDGPDDIMQANGFDGKTYGIPVDRVNHYRKAS